MKKVLLLSLLTLVLCVFGPINNALAQIPRVISYQAEMLDENGKPLNQTVAITFAIYEQQTGGTSVWTETQDVAVVNGFLNVYLGSATQLNLNFNKPYWLEVQVGNSAFPRTRLAAVPYALNAELAETANIATTVVDSAITQSKLAAGVQALPWGNAGGDLQGTYPNPILREGVVVENIKPGSITLDKLSPGITLPPGGPASGDLTGNYPDPLIAPGAVKTDRIFNGAVTTEKIADNSIITSKIENGAVTQEKLAADVKAFPQGPAGGDLSGLYPNPTVTGIQGFPVDLPTVHGTVLTYNDTTKTYNWQLPVDSVVTSLPIVGNGTAASPITLNTNGVTESDIMYFDGNEWITGQVQTASIADGAITTEKIVDGTIGTADIEDAAITTEKINNMAVTTEKISSDNEPLGSVLMSDGNGSTFWSNDLFTYPLTLGGDVTIAGNLTVAQDLSANAMDITNDLNVNGNGDFGTLTATTATLQDLNVVNDINVTHNLNVSTDLTVDGTGDFGILTASTATIQDLTVVNNFGVTDLTATGDISANNVNVTTTLTVDGTGDIGDLTATTATITTLTAPTANITNLNATNAVLTGTLDGVDANFSGDVDVAGTMSAVFGIFTSGAQSMAAPTGVNDLTNKAYVDGLTYIASAGQTIIDAINAGTGTINEAHISLPVDVVLTGADNDFAGANTVSGSFAPTGAGTITATTAATADALAATVAAGNSAITAINLSANTIDAARITLPTNVVLNNTNNILTSTTDGDVLAINTNDNTLTGSAIDAKSERSEATIIAENNFASGVSTDGMAGQFTVGGTNATVANALYARNYSNGNAFVAQADGNGYAIAIPDDGGRVKLSAGEGDGPVPARVSVFRFTAGAADFTIAGGELGQVVYVINATGGLISVYGNNIADGAAASLVFDGTTWVIL